jgi:hypothetical protein
MKGPTRLRKSSQTSFPLAMDDRITRSCCVLESILPTITQANPDRIVAGWIISSGPDITQLYTSVFSMRSMSRFHQCLTRRTVEL